MARMCPAVLDSGKSFAERRLSFPDAVVEAGWPRPNAPREIILDTLDLVSLEEHLRGALAFWRGKHPTDTHPGRDRIEVLVRLLGQSRRIRHPLLAEALAETVQAIRDVGRWWP